MPNVYIIAGPNGAGKTTFAREFLPNYADCRIFINADLIAQGLSPLAPESAALRAGRLMIEEIQIYASRGESFAFETTLSGRRHVSRIIGLKSHGYRVHLFYLWIPTVDLALSRIKERVSEGGHDVPAADVRRRFNRSIHKFLIYYRALADFWSLYANDGPIPRLIATEERNQLQISDPALYNSLVSRYTSS